MNAVSPVETLVTDHLDLWTAALKRKSTAGRGSSSKVELYGIRKLRELILELAVRGLLVPQDPNDEPASELLRKIAAEKARLVKEGKIKKETSPAEFNDEEARFALPKSWTWIVLGKLGEVLDSQRKPITKTDRNAGPYPYYGASGVVDYVAEYIFDEPLVLVGEDGAKWGRGDSTAFAIFGKTWVNNHAHVLRPNRSCVLDSYLVYFLTVTDLNEYITGMTVPKLNQARLVSIPVALPPLAEQHRIVAKVDELMALCDKLEQQTDASLGAHQTLVETLLSTLTSAADHAQFASAWQRIAGHFNTLFTTEESIAQLKQAILQLAVMGKLVPRDLSDEPAKELIARISDFREQSIASKRMKAVRKTAELLDSESDFDIPDNWAWCRLGNLVLDFRYGTSRKCSRESSGVPVLRIPNIQSGRIDSRDLKFTEMAASEYEELRLREGDLLLVRSNGSESLVGRSAVASADDDRFAYAGYLVRARIPREMVFSPYLHVALSTSSVRSQIEDPIRTTSGVKNINTAELSNLLLPLPPLAEQRRIVAKVDELMALCDQLKSRLSDAQTTQFNLADALVEQAIC